MEALACQDGVDLARERGIRRLVVETDSQPRVGEGLGDEFPKIMYFTNHQRY
jgi:hypothetical protein